MTEPTYAHVPFPSPKKEGTELGSDNAASHQGAIETFWIALFV